MAGDEIEGGFGPIVVGMPGEGQADWNAAAAKKAAVIGVDPARAGADMTASGVGRTVREHNAIVLKDCNALVKNGKNGPWLAAREDAAGKFYDPRGLRIQEPSESKGATLEEILDAYDSDGAVAAGAWKTE